jgi:hypothetical protein
MSQYDNDESFCQRQLISPFDGECRVDCGPFQTGSLRLDLPKEKSFLKNLRDGSPRAMRLPTRAVGCLEQATGGTAQNNRTAGTSRGTVGGKPGTTESG